jgi:signal transduction histidine kinase
MALLSVSIRWKMTLLYTGLLTVLLVAFGLFLFFAVERLLIGSLNETLAQRFAQALAATPQLRAELATPRPGSAPWHLPTLERLAGPGLFLQIRDPAGHVIATSTNLGATQLPPPSGTLTLPDQADTTQIRLPVAGLLPEAATTDITVARFQLRSGPLLDADGRLVGVLQVAQSLLTVDEVQDRLVDVLVEGMAVVVALALAAGIWLAGRLLHPIVMITDTAGRIGASGDLAQRIPPATPARRDEVGQLTATFNAMLERLERAFRGQHQFVADASHELKTPVTAILGHANLLRRRGKTHPELVDEALAAIIEQAERMHRLTRDLLVLATTGERPYQVMEIVSIDRVIAEVVQEFSPLAHERAIQLTMPSAIDTTTRVLGDRDQLKQMVVNLVDNALRYTPAGGQVQINAWRESHGPDLAVVLEVRDTGVGISGSDLPHIFERFYRVDKARSRSAGGSGLGLAIAQNVAHRHGGTVSVESQIAQGSVFQVRLPSVTGTGDEIAPSPC